MLEKKEYTEDKSYDCTKFEKHVTHVPVSASQTILIYKLIKHNILFKHYNTLIHLTNSTFVKFHLFLHISAEQLFLLIS